MHISIHSEIRKNRSLPKTETRTKLGHKIPSQETRAPENRSDLSRDRAPAWRAVLDGRLLVWVFAGHDVMIASLLRERLWVRESGKQAGEHGLTLSGLPAKRCTFEGADSIAQRRSLRRNELKLSKVQWFGKSRRLHR